ncbi:MAG: 50S ribosomal protein L13 [Nitrososphaerales archaeon]
MAVKAVKAEQPLVVDATHQVVGRMASNVAKLLIEGRRVVVVNAEKALISGSRKNIIYERMKRLEIKSIINPIYTPHHPKQPDKMLHKIIRGMLPRRKPKGQDALKRLRVYVGTPKAYRSVEKKTFEDAKARKPLPFYLTMGEVASTLGWRAR